MCNSCATGKMKVGWLSTHYEEGKICECKCAPNHIIKKMETYYATDSEKSSKEEVLVCLSCKHHLRI